jgi:uncharacterized protein
MGARLVRLGSVFAASMLAIATVGAADRRVADAARQQDKQAFRALLKQGVDVNAPLPDGTTALHWAAHWDDDDATKALVAAGADVNATTARGVTPLALACENGSAVVVERLLDAGAHANAAEENGQTPLMVASRTGNVRAVKALLVHGAQVNTATIELGQTPLMWATAERHHDIIKVLVENGADVKAQSKAGFTALMFAGRDGNLEATKLLLAAGASINQTGRGGTHALALTIANGHVPLALYLLDQGADPNAKAGGMTALHYAVRGGGFRVPVAGVGEPPNITLQSSRVELVKALLAHGASVNARSTSIGVMGYGQSPKKGAFDLQGWGVGGRSGATPFFMASDGPTANSDMLRVLLEGGADPALTADDKTTPLMVASGLGFGYNEPTAAERERMRDAVKVLVEEARVDVNAVNEAKFTALHGAGFIGDEPVIQYLVDHGARMDVEDFRGRTPFRIAEGHKSSTDFIEYPKAAALLQKLGANITLGVNGRVQEREGGQARDAGPTKAPQ